MFIPVAEKGVGAFGRYGREMLNCVRFGKLARADADDDASTSIRTRQVASQDEHCYVLSIEVRGITGPREPRRATTGMTRASREATAGRADEGEASTATRTRRSWRRRD